MTGRAGLRDDLQKITEPGGEPGDFIAYVTIGVLAIIMVATAPLWLPLYLLGRLVAWAVRR